MKEEQRLRVLCELMKNSRQSDRAIAKKLNVSQPTVTRARAEIEKEYVKEYTLIPDFAKIGYEVMAITFVKTNPSLSPKERLEAIERGRKWSHERPNIVFSSICQGMGMTGVVISFHKTYSDFIEFTRKHRAEWSDIISDSETVLISISKDHIVKPFLFSCLTEDIKEQ
jgi:DNA-binding Lrp family transcriptional regulator